MYKPQGKGGLISSPKNPPNHCSEHYRLRENDKDSDLSHLFGDGTKVKKVLDKATFS